MLLLGPLYHLVDRADPLAALREAGRVVRSGGVVVVAAISRWASALSGVHSGFLREDGFARIVGDDLATGVHSNPENRPGWFTTYFHRPEPLAQEVEEAGLVLDGPVGVEGVGGAAPDIDALLDDDAVLDRVLDVLRRTEREPALLGMSSHPLAAGRRD